MSLFAALVTEFKVGNRITVFGVSQPGRDEVSATYRIDDEEPIEKSLDPNTSNFPMANLEYYSSNNLDYSQHTLFINITKTGISRAYEFESFGIINNLDESQDNNNSNIFNNNNNNGYGDNVKGDTGNSQKKNTGAIVGSVLGAILGIMLLLLVAFVIYRRRQLGQNGTHPNSHVAGTSMALPCTDNSSESQDRGTTQIVRQPMATLSTQSRPRGRNGSSEVSPPSHPHIMVPYELTTIRDGSESPSETIYDPFYYPRKSVISSSL